MKLVLSAGGIVINAKGEVLMVSNRSKSWGFPKGKIHVGEGALEAAKREIQEETGIKELHLIRELGAYTRPSNDADYGMCDKTIIMFLFTTKDDDIIALDPNVPDAKWIDIDKVLNTITHKEDADFFRKLHIEP
jgi:diadenosine hexaphosphate hydrolase (ATP-forming)